MHKSLPLHGSYYPTYGQGEVQLPAKVDGQQLLNILYQKDWIIYAKAPFEGPHAVIEYPGRYTYKVATCLPAGQ